MMRWAALLGAALLVGCSVTPPAPPQADAERAWTRHRARVAALERWDLNGRLAVTAQDKAWHARIDWHQAAAQYDIRITAPFGQGAVQLQGGPQRVLLQTEDGEYAAADPERLLREELGWRVPVSSLRYWVLGLPAPGAPAQHQLDADGRLARLYQSGWDIEFLDYRHNGDLALPGKVFANSVDGKVKLVVGDWHVGAAAEAPG